MKQSFKPWKRKQQALHRKCMSVQKRFKRKKPYLKRTMVILLAKKQRGASHRLGAVLQFTSNFQSCVAIQAVVVSEIDKKQTSSKYIISANNRNKKLLKRADVTVTEKFARNLKRLAARSIKQIGIRPAPKRKQPSPSIQPVTPIKIYGCSICNHRFTKEDHRNEHMKIHDEDEESEDDPQLIIDDDVELILNGTELSSEHVPMRSASPTNLKIEPAEQAPIRIEKTTAVENNKPLLCHHCGKKFPDEESLVFHIAREHINKQHKKFQCQKCPESFARESALIAHDRICHTAAVEIEPKSSEKARRKSTHTKKLVTLPQVPVVENSSETATLPIHQCSICVFKSSTKAKLEEHINFWHAGSSKKVEQCNAAPKVSFIKYDSKKNKYCCSICSAVFPQRLFLDRHVLIHITKVYQCYSCFDIMGSSLALINHLKIAHMKQNNDPGFIATLRNAGSNSALFQCGFCKFYACKCKRVMEHVTGEHYDEFDKADSIVEEQQVDSPDSLENLLLPETMEAMQCNNDDAEDLLVEIPSKEDSRKNVRRKPNDPSFKFRCARCLKHFSRLQGLRRHICKAQPKEIKDSLTGIVNEFASLKEGAGKFLCCTKCSHVFSDKTLYLTHLNDVHRSSIST